MRLQSFVLCVKTDFGPKLELRFLTLAAHVVSLLGFCLQHRYPGSMLARLRKSSRMGALGQGMFKLHSVLAPLRAK